MFVQKKEEKIVVQKTCSASPKEIMTVDVKTKNDKFLIHKNDIQASVTNKRCRNFAILGHKTCIYILVIKPAILKQEQVRSKVVNEEGTEELDWSQWLDFDRDNIARIAESKGVYKIHAGMKILFIGSSENLRESLLECMSDPCMSKAKRFSYAITESADKVKEQLLNEYRSKHDGKLPSCM